jgi:hypothetical protein
MPLESVIEASEIHNQTGGMVFFQNQMGQQSFESHNHPGSMVNSEMDIDRMNFWWDHSYEALDSNVEQFNPNAEEGPSHYNPNPWV